MKKEYNGKRRTHSYIKMPDGTRLSAVIFMPQKDGQDPLLPLPVILSYTAYECLHYEPDPDGGRKIVPMVDFGIDTLTDYGYVIAVVQVRGCGASFGVRKVVASRQEAEDGAYVVDYLASRPWCDGNVMTAGQSYNGQTQLGILSRKPHHIRAAYIGKTDLNRYDGWVRNGIPRAFGSKPDIDWGKTEKEHEAVIEDLAGKIVPVDEDPEGKLLREALREHLQNGSQTAAQRDYNWRDSECPFFEGSFWDALSASTYLKDINESGAVVYLDGGVLDPFRRDTMLMYHNLTLRKKLIIGPWDHIRPKYDPEPRYEILRFADHVLKGIENGIMEEKPLTLRVMEYDFKNHVYQGPGTGYYRYEERWPLHEGKRDVFCLSHEDNMNHGDNNETHENPGGFPAYRMTRKGNPCKSGYAASEGTGLQEENPAPVQKACRPEKEEIPYRIVYGITSGVETDNLLLDRERGAAAKGLNFLTDIYEEDTEYIGHPFAEISFRMIEPGDIGEPLDVDLFVLLSDYDPGTGEAFQFCNGWMRSSLRNPKGQPTYDFLGLPWHDCKKGDNEYLEKDGEYTLSIDMMPVFYRIRKGHQILLTITCSLDRTYYAGRKFYEENPEGNTPLIALYTGGQNGSRLIMPNIYA